MDKRQHRVIRPVMAYVRLNMHRGIHQGKNLAILLCIPFFFIYYMGDLRTALIQKEELITLQELFLVAINTNYTALTIWVGFLLVICDIPYSEKGIYPYLLRSSKIQWLWGQLIYLFFVIAAYFTYIVLVITAIFLPCISWSCNWTGTFVKLISSPLRYNMRSYLEFTFSIIKRNSQTIIIARQILLSMLMAMGLGSSMITMHLFWKNGTGILIGATALACDYLVTSVLYEKTELLYISPLSLARINVLSSSVQNQMNPSFAYAGLVLSGLLIVALITAIWRVRKYEM